jgi:predicted metal-dependent phosphoesterase TrpH
MLLDLGHVESRQGAFDKYLEKYNYPNKDLSVQEVIDKIHGAGGLAVLAHPNSDFLSLKSISTDFQEHARLISELKEQGLDGLEVYRSEHSKEDTQRYLELAESLKLLALGGSDYHGANVESGASLASVDVPENVLEEMEAVQGNLDATHH